MTKTIFKILFFVLLIMGTQNLRGQTWQGQGTSSDPWQISTPAQLVEMNTYGYGPTTAGKYWILTNDINLQSEWTPISTFYGNFNGNGKVISNLTITGTTDERGLFKRLVGATIYDLGIENCNVTGGQYVGGLVGYVGNSGTSIITTISNCYVTGQITGTGNYTGGLVGYVVSGAICNITNCYTECNVTGTNRVGGLLGIYSSGSQGTISYCYTKGTITGNGVCIGGIIGTTDATTITVKNCVAANDTVKNLGTQLYFGKIIGCNEGTVQNCYSLNTMVFANGNGVNGTPKPLSDLQSQSFYTTSSNWNTTPWNFSEIWTICNSKSFPYFQYEQKNCNFTITPSATAGGNISPSTPQTIPQNSNITFTAIPDNCKEVDVWKINNIPVQTSGNTYTIQNVQSDQTVEVSFKTTTYTITPLPTTNGTISPNSPQTVDCNGFIVFTATPNTNYTVDKWFVDGNMVYDGGTEIWNLYNITDNHTIEVTFKYVPQPCIVTFNANGGNGTMTPQTFTEGVAQQLNWNQFYRNGYDFKEWNTIANGSGQSIPDGATITITSNWTLFAQWETTHIPVTNITNVPTTATVNIPLTLTGTVTPSNATYKTIVWSVKSAGTTNATISGNVFTATSSGTATITATIQNGIAIGTPYTKDFTIVVNAGFVAVTDITNVPTSATANVPLTLTATVIPSNATNQNIIWSVKSAGNTGATINGNVFTATNYGTATITATIQNGIAVGTPFVKDFNIKVDTVVNSIADYQKRNISVFPNPTNNYFTIKSEHPISPNITIYDITGRQMNAIIEYLANEIKCDISHL